jgi:hypothetical protein
MTTDTLVASAEAVSVEPLRLLCSTVLRGASKKV